MSEGKLRKAWDKENEKGHLALRNLLRPSLIAMAICGCHKYEMGFDKARKVKLQTYRVFETGYRVIFFFVCVAALAKSCTAFATNFVYINGLLTAWHLQNLIMFLVSFKSSRSKYGGQTKAFDFWDTKIREELAQLSVRIPEERFQRRQKVVLCLAALLCMFNIDGSILLIVDAFGTDFSLVISAPFSNTTLLKLISICILANQTLMWFLPLGYIILIATLLTMTLEELNNYLDNLITENCFNMACEFRRIRLLHLNLSKMISYLDKDFSYYFATLFVIGIGISCFNLYQIVRAPMDTMNLLMTLFWLLATLTILGIISVSAALLNEAVGTYS